MKWIKASELKNIVYRKTYFAKWEAGYPEGFGIKSTGFFHESDGVFFWHVQGYVPVSPSEYKDLFILDESESEHIEQPSDIVTDEEIDKAWENANFGDISKRKVILESLEKCVQGYRTGRTAECIVTELALVAEWHLTEKGLRYLKAAFKSQSPKQ